MDIYEFAHSEDGLKEVAALALAKAKDKGADAASVDVSELFALNVSVRADKTDSVSFSHGINFGVSVHVGKKVGHASGNSLAAVDLDRTVAHALAIAKRMGDDECEGLPDKDELAKLPGPDLDDYGPWRPSVDEMVAKAREMADASYAVDPRINRKKSDGSGVGTGEARGVHANSLGFSSAGTTSTHSLSCGVIADLDGTMETSYWGDSKVHAVDLDDHRWIAEKAARRAVDRDGARAVPTGKVPVVYETGVSHSLVRGFVSTLMGSRVYRNLTCYADKVGEMVCAGHVTLSEKPFLQRGADSAVHDDEGVATSEKQIVENGVLRTHLYGCYSARKMKRRSTGNAGGVHNLVVSYDERKLEDLLAEMGRGLLVTGLMGGGANPVTGDYSAGANGFWVENGEIVHPVRDATIAGRLQDMLPGIVAGGDDRLVRGGVDCGSVLVAEMMVAGAGGTAS